MEILFFILALLTMIAFLYFGIVFLLDPEEGVDLVAKAWERIKHPLKATGEANVLYQCKACNRYSRGHQVERAYWQAKLDERDPYFKDDVCPHCQRLHRMTTPGVHYEWLKTHPDCFQINVIQQWKHKKAIRSIKQAIEDMKSIKAFQEYHDLREMTPEAMKKMKEEINAPMQSTSPWASMEAQGGMIIHNYPDGQHDFCTRDGREYVRSHEEMEWMPMPASLVKKKTEANLLSANEALGKVVAMQQAWRKAGVNVDEHKENKGR